MITEDFHKQFLLRLKIDQDKILGKNTSERLIKPMYKSAKLIIKTNNKMYELQTYNEASKNFVYRKKL